MSDPTNKKKPPTSPKSRLVDAVFGGARQAAIRNQLCHPEWGCGRSIADEYPNWSEKDQDEYNISALCPQCFEHITSPHLS